jgi:choline dehydrogenase-like flavoprotein
MSQFDYIVVGAGAAGSVLAARLSEDARSTVLILEEGPSDKSIYIKTTGGYFKTHGTNRTFLFHTEPEPYANNRKLVLLQGRTLGGGTSVNSMCYSRGQRQDYEDWAATGCKGWSYEDVLPYFIKSEANSRLSGRYHGTDGPMRVSDGVYRHTLTEAFVRAAQETTLPGRNEPVPYNHDFNGEKQEGVGYYQTMSYRGERYSASRSFLSSARDRKNLSIRSDCSVTRIVFEGRRAVGVEVSDKSGEKQTIKAAREVILCAGAFMSPKLLMLSGVGPAGELKMHGIEVVCDSPNVGQNYQDHMLVPFDMELKEPISLNGEDKGLRMIVNGLQWLLFRTGLLASNVVESGAFIDFDGDGRPEIQLNALAVSSAGWGDPIPEGHRFSLAPLCLTCHSRGSVTLRSRDPKDFPVVRTNFLHDQDLLNLANGVEMSRRICAAPSLARYLKIETLPGPKVGPDRKAIEDYVRNSAKTALHPTATCAMGPGEKSVVDLELRVRGLEGLRVVDGSVIPIVPRGNTTAPIVMVAERAADMIRGRPLLHETAA